MAKYILSDIFIGDFKVTQFYGQRPEYYSQFGLKGHEGVDWGTPTGVKIVAPFDGQIVRDVDLPGDKSYGDFIVAWDPIQKCAVWYCHLKENYVSLNDKFKKGQVLGLTNNTGNSSGPHLHLNFVETDANGNRLNTNNGYQGFLNVLDPQLVEWKLGNNAQAPVDPIASTDQFRLDRDRNWNLYTGLLKAVCDELKITYPSDPLKFNNQTVIDSIRKLNGSNISTLEQQVLNLTKEREDLDNKLKGLKVSIGTSIDTLIKNK